MWDRNIGVGSLQQSRRQARQEAKERLTRGIKTQFAKSMKVTGPGTTAEEGTYSNEGRRYIGQSRYLDVFGGFIV